LRRWLDPDENATFLTGRIIGLRPGEHALHIHEGGDCSSPKAPGARQGMAEVKMVLSPLLLEGGRYNILGRSIVGQAGRDDLVGQPAGGAGDPVACGVIRAEVP
jgi:Cu-Zn family superoxide dismutase